MSGGRLWSIMGCAIVLLLPLLADAREDSLLKAVVVESVEAMPSSHMLLVAAGAAEKIEKNSDAVQPESKAADQGKKNTEADKPASGKAEADKPASGKAQEGVDPRREMDPSGGY